MAQYQSFPDAPGDSRTFEKLQALRLPEMAGKRFLDVGCNEGFFCGFASFQGAARSVGIDHSAQFIARARQRFPACEFLHSTWDSLPEGPFDVILLASALHYAEDQPALIERLVGHLSDDGVLVLELGIVSSSKSEWVKVERGIDERYFPTMPLLRELLDGYAWKWMGPSVMQDGDPVARHVVHISRPRRMAYLLMQPPAYGKTSIARSLFARAGVRVVSGDNLVSRVAAGQTPAPGRLRALLAKDYSPYRIDETIRRIFDGGLGGDLTGLWLQEAGEGDFALDAYVPQEHHGSVEAALREAGCMPVTLRWDRVGVELASAESLARQAEQYFRALNAAGSGGEDATGADGRRVEPQGFVDDVEWTSERLTLRGWAVDEHGQLPRFVEVRLGRQVHLVDVFDRQARPDVQQHLGLARPWCGFQLGIAVGRPAGGVLKPSSLKVRAGDRPDRLGPPLPLAGALVEKLKRGRFGGP